MVGDKKIDIETAELAKVRSCLVTTGYGAHHQHLLESEPNVIVESFGKAVDAIIATLQAD